MSAIPDIPDETLMAMDVGTIRDELPGLESGKADTARALHQWAAHYGAFGFGRTMRLIVERHEAEQRDAREARPTRTRRADYVSPDSHCLPMTLWKYPDGTRSGTPPPMCRKWDTLAVAAPLCKAKGSHSGCLGVSCHIGEGQVVGFTDKVPKGARRATNQPTPRAGCYLMTHTPDGLVSEEIPCPEVLLWGPKGMCCIGGVVYVFGSFPDPLAYRPPEPSRSARYYEDTLDERPTEDASDYHPVNRLFMLCLDTREWREVEAGQGFPHIPVPVTYNTDRSSFSRTVPYLGKVYVFSLGESVYVMMHSPAMQEDESLCIPQGCVVDDSCTVRPDEDAVGAMYEGSSEWEESSSGSDQAETETGGEWSIWSDPDLVDSHNESQCEEGSESDSDLTCAYGITSFFRYTTSADLWTQLPVGPLLVPHATAVHGERVHVLGENALSGAPCHVVYSPTSGWERETTQSKARTVMGEPAAAVVGDALLVGASPAVTTCNATTGLWRARVAARAPFPSLAPWMCQLGHDTVLCYTWGIGALSPSRCNTPYTLIHVSPELTQNWLEGEGCTDWR
ncbi:hypothetical protein KIPB_003981 [Kipferlia bialata]|uniref:Uncharacterized protein n=1 Tax=Kipferlia bialata TaxID=797122 RepID=A0A9K3GG84_9EUKA|nr:hypothetical protein KIPB_003981 [Kipferlia bialata]|eukprot:g3981.t1